MKRNMTKPSEQCKICNIWQNNEKKTEWFLEGESLMVIADIDPHGYDLCILVFLKDHELAKETGDTTLKLICEPVIHTILREERMVLMKVDSTEHYEARHPHLQFMCMRKL